MDQTLSTDEALKWVRNHKGKYRKFAQEAGLTFHWVSKFGQGRIPSPGAKMIEKVLVHRDSQEQ